jgi:hypothetical protein
MRDLKIREWTKSSPKSKGLFAVERENGKLDLVSMAVDSGHLYVVYVTPERTQGPITRHYGPLTTEELLSGIPKPPPRLPKAHPDRYLGQIVIGPHHRGEAILIGRPKAGFVNLLFDDGSASVFEVSNSDEYTNRYAQQDKDGVWREVEV